MLIVINDRQTYLLEYKISQISLKAFERLTDLNERHEYSLIALIESFQDDSEVDQYARRLGLTNALC